MLLASRKVLTKPKSLTSRKMFEALACMCCSQVSSWDNPKELTSPSSMISCYQEPNSGSCIHWVFNVYQAHWLYWGFFHLLIPVISISIIRYMPGIIKTIGQKYKQYSHGLCHVALSSFTYWNQWASCHSPVSCTEAWWGYRIHCSWGMSSFPKIENRKAGHKGLESSVRRPRYKIRLLTKYLANQSGEWLPGSQLLHTLYDGQGH